MPQLMSYPKAAGIYAARRAWKVFQLGEKTRHINHVGNMILSPSEYIDSRLYFFGTWEPSLTAFMMQRTKKDSVAIDIGANIGYYTLMFSKSVGGSGKVYSIEPSPKTLKKLRDNLALNQSDNVVVMPYGISDKAERREFVLDGSNLGASHFGQPSDNGLELVRLRSIIEATDLSRVSIVKVDVEGFEVPVLRDILNLISELGAQLTIVSEIRNTPEACALLKDFRASGFRALALSNEYRIIDYIDGSVAPPCEVTELPRGQTDIALVRD